MNADDMSWCHARGQCLTEYDAHFCHAYELRKNISEQFSLSLGRSLSLSLILSEKFSSKELSLKCIYSSEGDVAREKFSFSC